MALTTDKPRAASIIAVSDVLALSLNKSNFKVKIKFIIVFRKYLKNKSSHNKKKLIIF